MKFHLKSWMGLVLVLGISTAALQHQKSEHAVPMSSAGLPSSGVPSAAPSAGPPAELPSLNSVQTRTDTGSAAAAASHSGGYSLSEEEIIQSGIASKNALGKRITGAEGYGPYVAAAWASGDAAEALLAAQAIWDCQFTPALLEHAYKRTATNAEEQRFRLSAIAIHSGVERRCQTLTPEQLQLRPKLLERAASAGLTEGLKDFFYCATSCIRGHTDKAMQAQAVALIHQHLPSSSDPELLKFVAASAGQEIFTDPVIWRAYRLAASAVFGDKTSDMPQQTLEYKGIQFKLPSTEDLFQRKASKFSAQDEAKAQALSQQLLSRFKPAS